MKKQPVFVVGKHRSGTTWLANMLSNHSEIAAVKSQEHMGIHESAFFSHVIDNFFDIKDNNCFITFLESFSNSDYFILSGLDKSYFYSKRPTSYEEFFRLLMDTFAARNNKEVWIEKTPAHSLYLNEISRYYSDVKFISIQRDVADVVRSSLRLSQNKHENNSILKLVFRYVLYKKHIDKYTKKSPDKILYINFERLKGNPKREMERVCEFIGISFEDQVLLNKYKRNTSFVGDYERKDVLTPFELFFVKLSALMFAIVPYTFYRMLTLLKRRFFPRKLPKWFYSCYLKKSLQDEEELSVNHVQ